MSGLPGDNQDSAADAEQIAICSARGCPAPARWALLWNNPKIHTPDREKTWLACDEHRDSLTDFLSRRGFFRRYEPLSD